MAKKGGVEKSGNTGENRRGEPSAGGTLDSEFRKVVEDKKKKLNPDYKGGNPGDTEEVIKDLRKLGIVKGALSPEERKAAEKKISSRRASVISHTKKKGQAVKVGEQWHFDSDLPRKEMIGDLEGRRPRVEKKDKGKESPLVTAPKKEKVLDVKRRTKEVVEVKDLKGIENKIFEADLKATRNPKDRVSSDEYLALSKQHQDFLTTHFIAQGKPRAEAWRLAKELNKKVLSDVASRVGAIVTSETKTTIPQEKGKVERVERVEDEVRDLVDELYLAQRTLAEIKADPSRKGEYSQASKVIERLQNEIFEHFRKEAEKRGQVKRSQKDIENIARARTVRTLEGLKGRDLSIRPAPQPSMRGPVQPEQTPALIGERPPTAPAAAEEVLFPSRTKVSPPSPRVETAPLKERKVLVEEIEKEWIEGIISPEIKKAVFEFCSLKASLRESKLDEDQLSFARRQLVRAREKLNVLGSDKEWIIKRLEAKGPVTMKAVEAILSMVPRVIMRRTLEQLRPSVEREVKRVVSTDPSFSIFDPETQKRMIANLVDDIMGRHKEDLKEKLGKAPGNTAENVTKPSSGTGKIDNVAFL